MLASIISLILWFALLGSGAWFLVKPRRSDAPTIYGDVPHLHSSLRLHNDGGL
jgi:hypothetical protein